MKRFPTFFLVALLLAFALSANRSGMTADLKPIAGITAFGGALREPEQNASGIGGLDLVGLVPLSRRIGGQGGLYFQGGNGFRVGLNAGPVLNFDSGKVGLFVDYEHRAREDFNLVDIRGVGTYYLEKFDLTLSYLQPVSSVKRFDRYKMVGINELQGLVRFYPTDEIEVNGGLVVNSFAGPCRKAVGGTGVGAVFGVSFKLFDPVVLQLVQAKIDSQERYRVTSGIQLIFGSPLKDWLRSHIATVPGSGKTAGSKMRERPVPECSF
jgi:hypothetical protein